MNYINMFSAIIKELDRDKELSASYSYNTEMARAVELWSRMYRGKAPWNNDRTPCAGLAASIAAETAKLVTIEFKSSITGSEFLDKAYRKGVLPKLRKFTEYGLAKGSLVIKPIADNGRIRTQFIQADRFFPVSFDESGDVTKCVFAEQIRQGNSVFTLLEIHSIDNGILTVENRAYRSMTDGVLGSEIDLSEVGCWAGLARQAKFSGIDKLPFGLFRVPLANHIDSDSPLGVSAYSRAAELIREADRRYGNICWEYEAKEAAVHIAESMLDYDKEQDKYNVPEGRERLYRAVGIDTAVIGKPLLDVYSPEIRSSALYEGFNNQLRLIEFNCSLAYGTLSDPNNVDKTAEEIKSSKQRSYTFVTDVQAALENALADWAEGAHFWAQIYGFDSSPYDISFEWGDSILADPNAEREQDMKDLANGTLRPEEYRAKWRNEDVETALANLPEQAQVID